MRPNSKPFSLLLLLLILIFTTINSESTSALEYTHNVLVETATSVYCGVCNLESPKLQSLYEGLKGRFIPVNYHFEDEWMIKSNFVMLQEHKITLTPTHVFDGDYKKSGVISEKWLDKAATRTVHRVQLAIEKTIEDEAIRYEGSVEELDGQSLTGILRIYIVENGLIAQGKEWSFVLRALGLEREITLPPNGHIFFSGTWVPASEQNIHNIMIVASIWERNDQGKFVSIQATNDEYSPPLLTYDAQTLITSTSPVTSIERTPSSPQQTGNLPFFLTVTLIVVGVLTAFFFLYRNTKKKLILA